MQQAAIGWMISFQNFSEDKSPLDKISERILWSCLKCLRQLEEKYYLSGRSSYKNHTMREVVWDYTDEEKDDGYSYYPKP